MPALLFPPRGTLIEQERLAVQPEKTKRKTSRQGPGGEICGRSAEEKRLATGHRTRLISRTSSALFFFLRDSKTRFFTITNRPEGARGEREGGEGAKSAWLQKTYGWRRDAPPPKEWRNSRSHVQVFHAIKTEPLFAPAPSPTLSFLSRKC